MPTPAPILTFPTPSSLLRRSAARLCDDFAEEHNITTDTLWNRLVASGTPPDCLTFKPYDDGCEPELDCESQLLWDAVQRLKSAERSEMQRVVRGEAAAQ